MEGVFTHANKLRDVYVNTGDSEYTIYYSDADKCTHIWMPSGIWPVSQSVQEAIKIFQTGDTNERTTTKPTPGPNDFIPIRKKRKK